MTATDQAPPVVPVFKPRHVPMTSDQAKQLGKLCRGTAVRFNDRWSEATAADMIQYLKARKAQA